MAGWAGTTFVDTRLTKQVIANRLEAWPKNIFLQQPANTRPDLCFGQNSDATTCRLWPIFGLGGKWDGAGVSIQTVPKTVATSGFGPWASLHPQDRENNK